MESVSTKERVKGFILEEFLPGEDPASLGDATPLVTGGILDSLATLKLVAYIEEEFGIVLEAHEVDAEHLDSLTLITELIQSKK